MGIAPHLLLHSARKGTFEMKSQKLPERLKLLSPQQQQKVLRLLTFICEKMKVNFEASHLRVKAICQNEKESIRVAKFRNHCTGVLKNPPVQFTYNRNEKN
ncbi:hypothetical protein POVCU2_0035710 [Plasmodium ovale curtisi]|uniref:Uncharacterized protein n=1 Tax=Plasmodium ovale curtisi TaxID=864141 RepID=A0A1A8W2J6_PLAOA|nr:hypothetical protein POVCU2_0035710 [Plasmodium ovale curtisi]